MPRILIVEDKDGKFEDLKREVESLLGALEIVRATTVVQAEAFVCKSEWQLIILDVSMDIAGASTGVLGGGHANLGAIDVLDTMFYERLSFPTVVVTGFDYFISTGGGDESEFVGIKELGAMVETRIPGSYLGCLRYGKDGWKEKLKAILSEAAL